MSADDDKQARQYLTFCLDGEDFAFPIDRVREVLEFDGVTRVPRTPPYMRGVINLRGNVVPVIDLNERFGFMVREPTVDTCVVIIEVDIDGEMTVLGTLADSVQEVIDLHDDQIDPPPRLGSRLDGTFIHGMGKRDDEFVIVLDIDSILGERDLTEVRASGDHTVAVK